MIECGCGDIEKKAQDELGDRLREVLEGWEVDVDCDGFYVHKHSPAGEDVCVYLHGTDLEKLLFSAEQACEDFDPEDHAAQIYHAKHYGSDDEQRFYASAPSSLEALLEDAKAIENMYGELRDVINGMRQGE